MPKALRRRGLGASLPWPTSALTPIWLGQSLPKLCIRMRIAYPYKLPSYRGMLAQGHSTRITLGHLWPKAVADKGTGGLVASRA